MFSHGLVCLPQGLQLSQVQQLCPNQAAPGGQQRQTGLSQELQVRGHRLLFSGLTQETGLHRPP